MTEDDEAVTLVAAGGLDSEDVTVLARLSRLVQDADPVPAGLVERITFALDLDRLDAHLLELVYDSLTGAAPAAVRDRAAGPSRTLVFEGDGLGVEVELSDSGLEGQLIPGRPGTVTLRTREREVATAAADESGYFHLDAQPTGEVRLECTGAGADQPCLTPWFAA
jgi:hypothetical protein